MIKSEINLHGMCTESGILNIAATEHHRIAFTCEVATYTFDFEQTFFWEPHIYKMLFWNYNNSF